ncbi:O-antigen ligase family protein [Thermoflavimicrobium dichotomicum]|uniref:O-antigen ligase n=1 Tax=Thermoflavimicrobium dichotomicum TaxID=46223 RepID=A0A1I3JFG7_9BACL|nr:O-antigen ligase family protein [Thermoflavimicrobium dichotomicum]SFI59021.1 O-antigen ligase [Thermoflavimicrobium dichotomicum]
MKPNITRKWVVGLTKLLFFSILFTPYLPPVFLFFIGIITFFIYKERWFVNRWPEKIFLSFLLLSAVSWLFNPSWYTITTEPVPIQAFPVGIIPVFLFGFYYLLTIWLKRIVCWSFEDVKKMYLQFWLSGLYVVAIVFLQQLDWTHWPDSWLKDVLQFYKEFQWQSENTSRSVGTTGNSNITAALLICFALMSVYSLFILRKRWQKITTLAIFFLFCYAIYVTGSRGAWIGLVAGLFAQVWMMGYRKITLGISFSLAGLVVLFPNLIPRSETMMSTFQARLKIWLVALEIFKENWLLGTLPLHFGELFREKTGMAVYHAHNVFVGIAVEFGIIGLSLFMTLIIVTIIKARSWRKQTKSKEEKCLAGMLVSLIIALLGHGLYDYPLLTPQVGLIFMLSIIMIHLLAERVEKNQTKGNTGQNLYPLKLMVPKSLSAVIMGVKNVFKLKKEG